MLASNESACVNATWSQPLFRQGKLFDAANVGVSGQLGVDLQPLQVQLAFWGSTAGLAPQSQKLCLQLTLQVEGIGHAVQMDASNCYVLY